MSESKRYLSFWNEIYTKWCEIWLIDDDDYDDNNLIEEEGVMILIFYFDLPISQSNPRLWSTSV